MNFFLQGGTLIVGKFEYFVGRVFLQVVNQKQQVHLCKLMCLVIFWKSRRNDADLYFCHRMKTYMYLGQTKDT